MNQQNANTAVPPRQNMEADIVCAGFGPATGGFLTELTRGLVSEDGTPAAESQLMPGTPPQILCYERADDIGFGVSGVVTRGRAIRGSFPDLDLAQIPTAAEVKKENVAYLLDPTGASRRSSLLCAADKVMRLAGAKKKHAFELPYIPPFLRKEPGYVFSLGQFMQWAGQQVMASGLAQIWPGTPAARALIENGKVTGVRLADQGVDKNGQPAANYMPGMDIKARLTVVGDGPVGAIGRQLDEHFGLPPGNSRRDWAVGMKAVVELSQSKKTPPPGTVIHTLGYPEPELFGFLYVYPDNLASLGLFAPSWWRSPTRTVYRYLQHWMRHPYLWRHLEGGTLRSWGAKTVGESGRRGEPYLAGDGYARIGEGSGSTNILTNSGVDEAWATGVLLAKAVLQLLRENREFTRENLEATYVKSRRESWIEKEARAAAKARDGFQKGFVPGLAGAALAGLTGGKLFWPAAPKRPHEHIVQAEKYYQAQLSKADLESLRQESQRKGAPLHEAVMEKAGWPAVPLDGKLLVSHQDALLMGGKVQAPDGCADHVIFRDPGLCEDCAAPVCAEMCSGQAITVNPEGGTPLFDREKCVHCGACLWNCSRSAKNNPDQLNIEFRAAPGGLHSAEN